MLSYLAYIFSTFASFFFFSLLFHRMADSFASDIKISSAKRSSSIFQIPHLPPNSVVEEDVVGYGGFSCVYRGNLHGKPVAIKRIMRPPNITVREAEKILENELKLQVSLRPLNFVCQILGYQSSSQ